MDLDDLERRFEEYKEHAHEVLRIAGYAWSVVDGERWYVDPNEHIELRGVLVAYDYHQHKRILQEIINWYYNLTPILVEQLTEHFRKIDDLYPPLARPLSITLPQIANYIIPVEVIDELGRILGARKDEKSK